MPQGARLNELSQAVGLHKSTVFRLVRTLVDAGYAQQGAARGVYVANPRKRLAINRRTHPVKAAA